MGWDTDHVSSCTTRLSKSWCLLTVTYYTFSWSFPALNPIYMVIIIHCISNLIPPIRLIISISNLLTQNRGADIHLSPYTCSYSSSHSESGNTIIFLLFKQETNTYQVLSWFPSSLYILYLIIHSISFTQLTKNKSGSDSFTFSTSSMAIHCPCLAQTLL